MASDTPSRRYEAETRDEEIGATAGRSHRQILENTLGRERGMRVASGAPTNPELPAVEGDVAGDVPDAAPTRTDVDWDVQREINEKKIARHGDVGGER